MSFDKEILEQKKQTYKQLFGASSIISRPDNTISWGVFKESYYGLEKKANKEILEINENLHDLSKITKNRALKKNNFMIRDLQKRIIDVERGIKKVLKFLKIFLDS